MLNHFWMKSLTIFSSSLFSFSFALDSPSSQALANGQIDYLANRIQAHFTIKDHQSAYQEAAQAIQSFPDSELLWSCYIQAAARLGLEREMLGSWKIYVSKFPENSLKRQVIEEMAWGIIHKTAQSSSLIMRQMSLLAALISQDIKGINILEKALQDSNYAIRALAVELSSQLPDAKLIKQIKRLFTEEKVWVVRQKVIAAIGKMKIHEMQPALKALIATNESLVEERTVAIQSTLELLDYLERAEILELVHSNRAGLRVLACEAILYFQSLRDLDQLFILSKDNHPDVRLAALQAIGLLRPRNDKQKVLSIVYERIKDVNPQVAITAAWLLTLYAPEEGMNYFKEWLDSPQSEQRILASAALKATGKYGAPLSLSLFDHHSDIYVRLNLAIHLAGLRLIDQGVCRTLIELLEKDKNRWCQFEVGIFEVVATKQIFKSVELDSTPEMEDQLVRLEILNLLAILKSPQAQSVIKKFLTERSWGISGAAAILLLTEGDDLAIELVESLLKDAHPKVRLQAALILSLWSQEEKSIQVLEQHYVESSQEQKCRILEAIARIGSMKSVPFFLNVLNEPSQTLRLIAALGLIQCLNH